MNPLLLIINYLLEAIVHKHEMQLLTGSLGPVHSTWVKYVDGQCDLRDQAVDAGMHAAGLDGCL